ncbi:tyrosine--tRNA ligase [Actinospica sp. MGRD01-02]|uniref:Tyrosine--tRNA ligase n=1 Tax=Actinospica acidithermotolerans TaxID=2828514 RepID=A0A941IJF2_9ACTN|nr:tyrosine--tRNA ligase [Actinospica acidithermotolerans]MBR7827802.1 tyrosine--tRNA ligase [Actinospica acidithermotolerans]
MLNASTRLGASSEALMKILRTAPDLRTGPDLRAILEILAERRAMDLSDLTPAEQAELIAARTAQLLPSVPQLAEALQAAGDEGRQLIVKFGIDPTAADVHVGHAVPMIIASRFQRMGHRVVFIIGDITAKIGDPTGRTADRPPLTDEDIQHNLATYRQQVTPFFDFERADFRFNSEWLAPITLPQFIGVLEKLPLSVSLQREDFRTRLAEGSGLSMAELVYSVVMALDSVEITADIELGGLDQLLNMQMCRRVMENSGQKAEIIIATGLIEGTDGTGAKMSKSKGNYVGLAFEPKDVFGKLMSAADRLLPDYLRTLTELLDPEIELLLELMASRELHPMGVKTLLAAEMTSTIHGLDAAEEARAGFTAQFSQKRYSDTPDVPQIDVSEHGTSTVGELFVKVAGLVPSQNQLRRTASGGGLRLVSETPDGGQETVTLTEADANTAAAEVFAANSSVVERDGARNFLRCGRALIELR